MADARAVAVHCEAVKTAYRQTKEGMVISFAIHPSDLPPELALAPVGTRVMLAVAQIGEDEQPVEHPSEVRAERVEQAPAAARNDPSEKARRARDAFRDLPRAKQDVVRAARLVKDERFQRWVLGAAFETKDPDDNKISSDIHLKARLGILSKAEIGEDPAANERYHALVTDYLRETGQAAEDRGG